MFANLEGGLLFSWSPPPSEELSALQDMFPNGEHTKCLADCFENRYGKVDMVYHDRLLEFSWKKRSVIAGEFVDQLSEYPNIDFKLNS